MSVQNQNNNIYKYGIEYIDNSKIIITIKITTLIAFLILNLFNKYAYASSNVEILNKITSGYHFPTDFVVRTTTRKEDIINILTPYINEIGISVEEFKYFHYNRNQFNANHKLEELIDIYTGVEKEGFSKLSPDKTIFHQIGDNESENFKIVSEDGKSEYIIRYNIFSQKYEIVDDEVNKGTYNIYNPEGGLAKKGAKHFLWDVLPWLLWGNSEEDSTTYEYRLTLSQLGSAIVGGWGYHVGTYTEEGAREGLEFWLQNCRCEHDTSWLASQTPPLDPPFDQPPTNEDITDENKDDTGDQPPPPVADNRYRGFIAGTVGAGSLFTYTANAQNNGRNVLNPGPNTIVANDGSVSIDVNAEFGGYRYTAWGAWDSSDVTGTLPFYPGSALEKGHFVIGRVTTPVEFEHRVNQRSTARYEGRLAGTSFQGGTVGGVISLNANLANRMIGGTVDFTHNGSAWVSGDFLPSSIDIGSSKVTYRGDLSFSSGGGGSLSGMFYGPNAEETGGEWAIWNVPDSIGGADGVFRAKE